MPARASVGRACLAVVLLVAAGCSSGSGQKAIPTTTTAPSPATRAQVVDMIAGSFPESPALNRGIIRAHWRQVVVRLPLHLPPPISQQACASGPLLIVR